MNLATIPATTPVVEGGLVRTPSTWDAPHPILNAEEIRNVMFASFEDFARMKGAVLEGKGKRRHIYINRGSNVLGVAHLDTVQEKNPYFWMNHTFIQCPFIDNRLGAWVILKGMPDMGFMPDILLTEGEERGQSTARSFTPPEGKTYNWTFSFDRMNDDVALYGYLTKMAPIIKPYGLEGTHGSYSDIRDLEHLGCLGMNVGCGMRNYHSDRAHAYLPHLVVNMRKVRHFAHDYADVHLPFVKPKWEGNTIFRGNEMYYGDEYWEPRSRGSGSENYHERWGEREKKRLTNLDKRHIEETFARREFYFGEYETVEDWWMDRVLDPGKMSSGIYPHNNKRLCAGCNHWFLWQDTFYMSSRSKSFCVLCFLEEAVEMELLDKEWRKQLQSYKFKEIEDAIKEIRKGLDDGEVGSKGDELAIPPGE